MALIDIEVYPYLSPRIVEVLSPTTEVSIQDLVDSIRAWEDSEEGMFYEYIIDAAGKEALGGGVSVGITATLNNAQIMFTGRTAPIDNGAGRTCDLTDSLGTTLYVNDAQFLSSGIAPGMTVYNATTQQMASITRIPTENTLYSFPINNSDGLGATLGWTAGDSYVIYDNTSCNIAGGNLVAIDASGNELSPIFTTPNTQILRTASSSATQTELDAIQYSSYQNAVWIDSINGITGTAYPAGTREHPVNNFIQAKQIANAKGFSTLQILSSTSISNVDLTGFKILGQSPSITTLVLEASATLINCNFAECQVSGVLDGGSHILHCEVGTLDFFNGSIEDSGLYGNIALNGGTDALFVNCYTGMHSSIPTIDMGNSGQSLTITNYTGPITIQNLNDVNNYISIGLDSGMVILSNTILSANDIIIGGVGTLINLSTADVDTAGLLSTDTIADSTLDELIENHNMSGTVGETLRKIRWRSS
jgi:hypothetical protein